MHDDVVNKEIIETYWNVKQCQPYLQSCLQPEIIETYWNVK